MNVDKKTGAYEAPGIECLDIKAEAGFAATGGETQDLKQNSDYNDTSEWSE